MGFPEVELREEVNTMDLRMEIVGSLGSDRFSGVSILL